MPTDDTSSVSTRDTAESCSGQHAPSPQRRLRVVRRQTITAWGFLSVPLLLFIIFIAGPLVVTIVLSFFSWDTFSSPQFVGLENYRSMMHDVNVRQAFVNTLFFTVATVILHIVLALALALAVNRPVSRLLRYFVRTAYFFPVLISAAAASLIWLYMVDPSFGFVNYYFGKAGYHDPPNWLLTPNTALPVLIVFDVWRTLGFTFVIILAGLQGIPQTLYEAARVDGAGLWRQFRSVTIPMLSPTLLFASITAFSGAFQIFDPMYVMTQGGPGNKTLSLVMEVYNSAFRDFRIGYGSAIAVLVAVVIVIVSFIQLFLSRYWVTYERF